MYYYVSGTLAFKSMGFAVIDAGGVGYRMTVSQNTYDKLPLSGNPAKLYTYLAVREDGIELFGFFDETELSSFQMLITVSGVGPKAAMAILSLLTPDRLSQAIVAEDIKAISKANGVGAKTAARVVLELRDKVAKQYFAPTASANVGAAPVVAKGKGNLSEALDALVVLGYTRTEAQKALTGIDPKLDVEKIIPLALAKLL